MAPRSFALLLAPILGSLAGGCSRAPATSPAAATRAVDGFPPRVGGVTDYAGSGTCRECHQKQYATWHRSYHRTMTQLPAADAVQADFNHVTLTNAGVRFVLNRTANQFWIHMESVVPGTIDRPAPEPGDVPLGLVTGSHHMQVFWVPNGMGNCQVGFPFTWLIPERRWVPRNSTFLRPPNLELRPETWNFVCARCHATASQPNLDRAALTWRTQVEELGIACEACHGPGARHVAQQRERKRRPGPPNASETNLMIVHPEKIPPVRAAQICGFCHSMKWWDEKEGWPERGFSYRPGDDLEATTPIIRPRHLDRQPWLHEALAKNPNPFADFFWSDGMIRVSGRDYNGLIESPCYRGGRFSCLACHALHGDQPDGQLARNRTGNEACTQCHERFRAGTELTAHTHHSPPSTGSQCYNCHMPHTTYGVLKAIRSHQISSPKVADELATGRPNACNLCHLDQPLAWTAQQLAQWYRQPAPKLSEDQTTVADSARLALTGDAGQRVLEAWHFAWAPAVQTSGPSWIPPVLGQLLDDPYAAVRCVAERSLKQIAPALLPAGYDYTVSPDSRPAAQPLVLAPWSRATPPPPDPISPASARVRRGDLPATQHELQRLASQRNDRPVRLRE